MKRPTIHFESIDHQFLKFSREWLGDADFRDLIMAEPINQAAQEVWFASLPHRKDYRIWGVKSSGEWIGACGIKNIDQCLSAAEYWGYIYAKELRGRGLGWEMYQFLASQAVDMKLEKLWLRVSVKNKIAIKSYERWGFSALDGDEAKVVRMEVTL